MQLLQRILLPLASCAGVVFCQMTFASEIDYVRQVRPILATHCFACHGADEGTREADLRLDHFAGATTELESGDTAIIPGKPAASSLVARITTKDADELMPPKDSGHVLKPEEIDLLRKWIEQGGKYQDHWAFTAPKRSTPPVDVDSKSVRNNIDRFVLARLKQHDLKPTAPADRYTLVRRVYLDLIGIPPTPQEADAFANDKSPDAFEKLVDHLLASPRYGEHWAGLWLDLARFADTQGYEKDNHRDIWAYRDWVIEAFNRDLPYDQFTIEQIAGDLLPEPSSQQLLATAFHRNTMTNTEGGTDDEEFRTLAVKDRVETTIQVWMGLTMQCGNCHSHKYDPITQKDYYSFLAYFNQTEDADRGNDTPRVDLPTPMQQLQIDELKAQLDVLGKQPDDDKEALAKAKTDLENKIKAIKGPSTPVMKELPDDRQRKTHINIRGSFLDKGDLVTAAVPAEFHPMDKESPQNRLGVAQWLVDRDNPLTARVHVNRIWARLFGEGLVKTEEDFGTQGMLPSHPQLLDYLAVEWVDTHGWSQKKLLKQIVMSATYQQSSIVDATSREADPVNKWLSRGPRFRLTAEAVRDQALASSGLLSKKMFGKSVMPPQPEGIWQAVYNRSKWVTSAGEDRYRRALYTYVRRTSPYPVMLTFDAGSREICMQRRVRTNTPLQALITLNDPVYVEAAGALARRVTTEENVDAKQRIANAFRFVLIRPPSEKEIAILEKIYHSTRDHFANDSAKAAELLKSANMTTTEDMDVVDMAAWTTVANVLLNLDETLMKG